MDVNWLLIEMHYFKKINEEKIELISEFYVFFTFQQGLECS